MQDSPKTIQDSLYRLANSLYPGLDSFDEAERSAAAGYVIRIIAFLPLSLIGLVWLVTITDLGVLRAHWLLLAGLFVFMLLLSQLWLQTHYTTESGGYRAERRSFWGEALWSGVLVWGPSVAWLGVILPWLVYLLRARGGGQLYHLRVLSQSVFRTSILLPTLVEVVVYRRLGGSFPLPGLSVADVLPAVAATLVGFSLGSLMIAGVTSLLRTMSPPSPASRARGYASLRFSALMILIGLLAGLVAVFPAGLYSLAGPGAFFAFLTMLLGAAFVTDQLGRSIESARLRTRELEQLEQLARAFIQSPPDATALPALLRAFVPQMFPACQAAIGLFPDQALLTHPPYWAGPDAAMWAWQPEAAQPHEFRPGMACPWDEDMRRCGIVLLPIIEAQGRQVIGRVYLRSVAQAHAVDRLIPAGQTLASQIASVLYGAQVYRQTLRERLALDRAEQELAIGARVQASFLPEETPQVEGWEMVAMLQSARETSGDFYDFIPFDDGRIGIVVADVADKGLGAAFYMALSRTLLRAYAVDHAARYASSYTRRVPEVLTTMNKRVMQDTHTGMFVTLFYGIIDPRSGVLTYANARHNPPYLLSRRGGQPVKALGRTGLPVGILEDTRWERGRVRLEAGDTLVLYTDGLIEVEDGAQNPFGPERLQRVILDNLSLPVQALCDALLDAAQRFAGGAPRFDDITLMIVRRKAPSV